MTTSGSSHDLNKMHAAAARGFSLVSAIFLLIVLSVLGAAIVGIATSQQTASALDVQGARVYQAARAGIEWGLHQRLVSNSCQPATSFALPAGTTLEGFTVTVNCTQTAGPAAAVDLTRWLITATACNQPVAGSCPNPNGDTNYLQRVLQVRF